MGTRLETFPLHLGLGATAVPQPEFTDAAWYEGYVTRHAADGREGRLVSAHHFTESWDSWEMHPEGDEVVLCTGGRIVLYQEFADGRRATVTLEPGEYAVNPPGVWHAADVAAAASAVFITVGWGTQHRPR